MKGGGEAQVLYRDSSSLADTEILKKKKKKNISNERNPLVAATQEFEEHGQRSAGWKLQYVRGEVRGFLGKIGNDKSECFSFVTVVEDNL